MEQTFTINVQGYNLSVNAVLDKNTYEPGETAQLTIDVISANELNPRIFGKVTTGYFEQSLEIFTADSLQKSFLRWIFLFRSKILETLW